MDYSLWPIIDAALQEDIGSGDITTDSLIPPGAVGEGWIVAKEPLVLAGLTVARRVFERLSACLTVSLPAVDGDEVSAGTTVLTVKGDLAAILKAERTALNFLQHLSGIATFVRSCLSELDGTAIRLVDTRKTTPGLRVLEKYAVRVGGAANHRLGLFDGVLIKDNHIAACGSIKEAVSRARKAAHHLVKIEVEVTGPGQVDEALAAGADVIMLDNMAPAGIAEAVRQIDGRALVEVSGSVTREQLKTLSATGVDIISAGALTHSARSVDLSMQITGGQSPPDDMA